MGFVCFVVVRPTREFFTHIEASLARASNFPVRRLWSLSSEGFLACHIYCDTGHLFLWSCLGPSTLTPVAKRLTVHLSPLLTT